MIIFSLLAYWLSLSLPIALGFMACVFNLIYPKWYTSHVLPSRKLSSISPLPASWGCHAFLYVMKVTLCCCYFFFKDLNQKTNLTCYQVVTISGSLHFYRSIFLSGIIFFFLRASFNIYYSAVTDELLQLLYVCKSFYFTFAF